VVTANWSRLRVALILALTTLVLPEIAGADETSACLSSYVKVQELRTAGRLRAARDQAAVCGRDVCPRQLRDDCVGWMRELDASLPSIVLSVHAPDDTELTSASIAIDGEAMPDALDGRAHAVDPGPHRIRAEAPGFLAAEVPLLAHQGEHDRPVKISLQAAAQAGGSPWGGTSSRSGSPALPILIPGAVGGAGLGVFATFGLWGYFGSPGYQSLHACEGHCSASDVDTVRTRFLVSDVGLFVGVAGAAVATFFWLRRGPRADSAPNVTVSADGMGWTF